MHPSRPSRFSCHSWLLLLALACAAPADRVPTRDTAPSADSAAIAPMIPDSVALRLRADEIVAALEARDGARLAESTHPAKGVRFSPYPYVQTDSDVVIPRDGMRRIYSDSTVRLWGYRDGSGDPIRVSFADYAKRFVYDVDFVNAPQRRINREPIRPSNALFNLRAAYPGAHWVEYHFPGFDEKYEGMDWRSLWLVLEQVGADFFLVGVVHGSWTG